MTDTYADFLASIPPLRQPRKPKARTVTDNTWKQRYEAAYQADYRRKYPAAFAAQGYIKTTYPDTSKSNGLTMAIIKFLLWSGHNADRTGTQGRMIRVKGEYKRIPSANRKGTADISATIKGRACKFEIKVGADKPSPEQLREQELERSAGGQYEIIHNMGEFFLWYDGFLLTL